MGRNISFHFILFIIVPVCAIIAQPLQFNPHLNGNNLFSGGVDTPRFQFVDIDADSDLDLFILDRDEMLWFYTNNNDTFILEPSQSFGLEVGSWFRFIDIDSDGDPDCFTNGQFSDVSLFTNIGSSSQPQFQKTISSILDTSGNELFSERFSIPTFADIDGDGDYDFFSGSQSGSITLYENAGTPKMPRFAYSTSEFNGIKIIGGGLKKVQHGASGIEFFDEDSNGTLDLFWGDYFNRSMYALKNIGNKNSPNFILTDSTYPKGNPVVSFGFNIPQHADIDRDGLTDLMVGSVFPTEGYDNLWFFKNVGTNGHPVYTIETKNFLTMIDVGNRSSVAIGDYDGDNDPDLCISSGGGKIHFFENMGSAQSPQFSAAPAATISLASFYVTVASHDLNGDGKPDLLVGDFSGTIRFFKNETAAGLFNFSQQSFPLDAINVGNSSSPCIADIDNDGLPDILIGNSGGTVSYYKNTGSAGIPSYSLETAKFNNIDVGNDATPCIIDVDGNGNNDLFIGNSEGKIARFQFNPATLMFDSVTNAFSKIDLNINVAPAFADINSDGDQDLFIGNGKGGVYFYENITVADVQSKMVTDPPFGYELFQNFPNPFNPTTTIRFSLGYDAMIDLTIFSVIGKEIEKVLSTTLRSGQHSVSWNASRFPSGTYFYRLTVLSKNQRPVVFVRPMVFVQ